MQIQTFHPIYASLLLLLTSCKPEFYSFSVSTESASTAEPIIISWQARGKVTMGIHDIPVGSQNEIALDPIKLEISRDGKTDTCRLRSVDTIVMTLSSAGELTIRMTGDDHAERLRYIRFVARRFNKDSKKDKEIPIYPRGFHDQIGFARHIRGDTLVSEGSEMLDRWADSDEIVTVADSSGNDQIVTHAGMTATIPSGGVPSHAFAGTPAKGWWSIYRLLTPEERANPAKIPKSLNIYITIKRR